MENKEIAQVFKRIAAILEIKGGNPFRIRSFERSAQIIEDLPFGAFEAITGNLEALKSTPGIGEGTLSKIREIVATGTCQELAELTAEVPASLLELMNLQNLGPKRISQFWKGLGIVTVDELETAARAGRLRRLSGMGEKSERKVLESIEAYRRRHGRARLDVGLRVSDSIVAHLKERAAAVRRVAAAGSVRRRRETIGDIDILVTTDAPQEAVDAFLQHPDVEEVVAKGPTKTSVRLKVGLSCDLRVVEDDAFGAALQYFTGSKEHNVVLRERAKRKGLKISEYGLFRVVEEIEEKVAGRDEDEIYRLLGLQPVPPELRENRGEIEAAEDQLPVLLKRTDLRGDLHLHTLYSDGKCSLEEMAEAGLQLGYEYIAVTDHSQALAMTGGLDERRLAEQGEAIDAFNATNPGIRVLKGIEVDILEDGELDLSDAALRRLDIVVASVHSRFNLTRREMTSRVCRALGHPAVNVLGHPTGRILLRRDGYPLDIEEVLRQARESGVSLEVNSLPKRLDLSDVHCRMARDMGVRLAINSDAHHRDSMDLVAFGVDTARRGWIGPGEVINTFPLPRLTALLKKESE